MQPTTQEAQRPREKFAISADLVARERRRKLIAAPLACTRSLVLTALPLLFGYGWLVLNSFSETLVHGVLPEKLSLKNWRFLVEPPVPVLPDLWRTTWNTALLAVGMTVTVVAVSTPTAYALSRLKFVGRNAFLALTLVLHAFPGITLLISTYYVLRALNLLNSITGVFLVKAALMLPLAIWVMKGFYDNISWDVEMSALVDGGDAVPDVVQSDAAAGDAGHRGHIHLLLYLRLVRVHLRHHVHPGQRRRGLWPATSTLSSATSAASTTGCCRRPPCFTSRRCLLFFIFTQKYLMRVTIGGTKGGS